MGEQSAASFPECVSSLWWDVDASQLDTQRHRDFIIGRILASGTLDAIRWARSRYGDDGVREWIVRHEGRQLSGPQVRFWQAVIGLPVEQVNRWLNAPERRLWEGASS
jgi:hypothetical protein